MSQMAIINTPRFEKKKKSLTYELPMELTCEDMVTYCVTYVKHVVYCILYVEWEYSTIL